MTIKDYEGRLYQERLVYWQDKERWQRPRNIDPEQLAKIETDFAVELTYHQGSYDWVNGTHQCISKESVTVRSVKYSCWLAKHYPSCFQKHLTLMPSNEVFDFQELRKKIRSFHHEILVAMKVDLPRFLRHPRVILRARAFQVRHQHSR